MEAHDNMKDLVLPCELSLEHANTVTDNTFCLSFMVMSRNWLKKLNYIKKVLYCLDAHNYVITTLVSKFLF